MRQGRGKVGIAAAIACLALLIYALAPLAHGLVHADHGIVAALGHPDQDHGQTGRDADCALFQLYSGYGAHALTAPGAAALAAPLPAAYLHTVRLDPLPAGAPRRFALGRGPPHRA